MLAPEAQENQNAGVRGVRALPVVLLGDALEDDLRVVPRLTCWVSMLCQRGANLPLALGVGL